MVTLIADSETDGLLDSMTKLHMVQLGDADGEDVVIYSDISEELWRPLYLSGKLRSPVRPLKEGIARLRAADRVVFHNGICFDFEAVNRFFPWTIRREQLLDTLVMARLFDPEERVHTLRAWGERLGVAKGDYTGDFKVVDEEMLVYAEQDIVVGRALYRKVKEVLEWGCSCQLEHDVAWAIHLQELNGFAFDVERAKVLDAELRGQLAEIEGKLQEAFPPIERSLVFTPKVNNTKRGYRKGVPFTKRWLDPFNPASRAHIAERLQILGWKPKAFGKDGVPTVDEKVLSGIKLPNVDLLLKHFTLQKKLGMLADGKNAWLKMVKPDGRIYGRVNPNGACTGRMSHSKPNVAQVDKDHRMRSLWKPREGWKEVGCDAEGLEARMLAHYLARYDKGAFADRVVNGKKEDRSDVHSANVIALVKHGVLPKIALTTDLIPGREDGEKFFALSRNKTKAYLYALMYGAQDHKLGTMVKEHFREMHLAPPMVPPRELGALLRSALARAMRGLDLLTEAVQKTAQTRGYIIGLDGRHIKVRSRHAALNTLLQGGGAIVMKKALCLFMEAAPGNGLIHRVQLES